MSVPLPGENSVYYNTVDGGAYSMTVQRLSSHRGQLIVEVADGKRLLDQEVGLFYGAIFGPDVADVLEWEDLAIKAIDEYIGRQPS